MVRVRRRALVHLDDLGDARVLGYRLGETALARERPAGACWGPMALQYLWLALEGLGIFGALGAVLAGLGQLHERHFDAALGWFAVWAAGCAFHEWRKDCRRRQNLTEPREPS
jgi:hypothetical protein